MKKIKWFLTIAILTVFCIQIGFASISVSSYGTKYSATNDTSIYLSPNSYRIGNEVTVTVNFEGSEISKIIFNVDFSDLLTFKSCSNGTLKDGRYVWSSTNTPVSQNKVVFVFWITDAHDWYSPYVELSGFEAYDKSGNSIGDTTKVWAGISEKLIEHVPVDTKVQLSKSEIKVGDEFEITVKINLSKGTIKSGSFTICGKIDGGYAFCDFNCISGFNTIKKYDGVTTKIYFEGNGSSSHTCKLKYKPENTSGTMQIIVESVEICTDDENFPWTADLDSASANIKILPLKTDSDKESEKDNNTSSSGTETWYKVKTSGDPLNMRSGPGTDFGAVTQIPNGADVQFVESSGDWTKVTYNGKTGYVSSKYITVDYDTEEPIESETQEATVKDTVEIRLDNKTFAIVNDSESIKAPDGFIKTTATVDGKEIIAFQNDDFSKQGKYLVYVLEEDDKTTAYVYDSKSGSIEKYKSSEKVEEKEKATEEISATEPNTKEDNIVISKKTVIIIGAVSAAFLAALTAIIILSVKLKKQKLGGAEKTDKPEGLISDSELNGNDDLDRKEESTVTDNPTDGEELAEPEKESKTKKKEKAKKPPKPKKQKKNKDKKPENVPIQIVLNRQPETDNNPKE